MAPVHCAFEILIDARSYDFVKLSLSDETHSDDVHSAIRDRTSVHEVDLLVYAEFTTLSGHHSRSCSLEYICFVCCDELIARISKVKPLSGRLLQSSLDILVDKEHVLVLSDVR